MIRQTTYSVLMLLFVFTALAVSPSAAEMACECCKCHAAAEGGTAAAPAATEHDPVCGMNVDGAKAKKAGRVSEYKGKTVYFCSDDCKKKFDADPAKYETAKPEKASH